MKHYLFKNSKTQLLAVLFVIIIFLPLQSLYKNGLIFHTQAQMKLICPPDPHDQSTLQMVGCYVPTDTPAPAFKALSAPPTPTPTIVKVPPTTGPPSKCSGTIVSFDVQKKLLKFGDGRPGTCFKPKWIVM